MAILARTAVRLSLLAMVLTLGCAVPALGQVRSIKGKALDEQGNPIADAKVTISGMDIKRSYNVKTNKKGE